MSDSTPAAPTTAVWPPPAREMSERELNTALVWRMTRVPLGQEGYEVLEEVTRRLTEIAALRQRLEEADAERDRLQGQLAALARGEVPPGLRLVLEVETRKVMENAEAELVRRAAEAEAAEAAIAAVLADDPTGHCAMACDWCAEWSRRRDAALAPQTATLAAAVLRAADEWERAFAAWCQEMTHDEPAAIRAASDHLRTTEDALAATVRQLRESR